MENLLSKYYDLKEVKSYNDLIISFKEESTRVDKKTQRVFELSEITKPYDSLRDYVKGSDKYNKILKEQEEYDKAKKELESISYTCEKVSDEFYINGRIIYKHSFVGKTEAFYYDDEEAYSYLEDFTFVFFSLKEISKHHVISDFESLLLPYTRKVGGTLPDEDLIDEALMSIEYAKKEIFAYQLAERCGVKRKDIDKLFYVQDLEHYTEYMSRDFVKYKDKSYYDSDIINLLEEFEKAKGLKYIEEDKIVDYPGHYTFVDFKEKNLEVYKEE